MEDHTDNKQENVDKMMMMKNTATTMTMTTKKMRMVGATMGTTMMVMVVLVGVVAMMTVTMERSQGCFLNWHQHMEDELVCLLGK